LLRLHISETAAERSTACWERGHSIAARPDAGGRRRSRN